MPVPVGRTLYEVAVPHDSCQTIPCNHSYHQCHRLQRSGSVSPPQLRDHSLSWFLSVTGASAGLGCAVTEHALQQGDSVVATLRKPEVLSDLLAKYPSQLLVLSLDVKYPEQIHAAFENALERFGRVDVVLNNAGICVISEAEGMSDERGRELFEVLFWGATNVTKEAVKIFRERNNPPGGRLLQVSSRTALRVVPGVAHYAAAYVATPHDAQVDQLF